MRSRQGRAAEALAAGEEAVRLARNAGDPRVLAFALGRLALASLQVGEIERARSLIDEAEEAAVAPTDSLRALFLAWRAQLATATGDSGSRLAAFTESARIHEEMGDLRRAAGEECNAADVLNRVGAYDAAIGALEDACEKCRRVGHRAMEGYALLNLGHALTMRGAPVDALTTLADASAIAAAIAEARLSVLVEVYRARALLSSGDAALALATGDAAAARAEQLGLATPRIQALTRAASAALESGACAAALERSTRAYEALVLQGGAEEDEAEVYLVHASALRAHGRETEAGEVLRAGRERIVAIAGRITDEDLRARFLRDVAAHRELVGV